MEEKSNIGWIIVAIIAIVAIVGLVLLFKASITGDVVELTAGELGIRCTACGGTGIACSIQSVPIQQAAEVCRNLGGHLESSLSRKF